jgi:hypothetical protein
LSGTDNTVPIRHESKDIGLGPSKIIVNAATTQSGPTEEVPGSFDPPGGRYASPDPPGAGLASSDPQEMTPPCPTPGVGSTLRSGGKIPKGAHAASIATSARSLTQKGKQVCFPLRATMTGHPCEQICFHTACNSDRSSPWVGMLPRGLQL